MCSLQFEKAVQQGIPLRKFMPGVLRDIAEFLR